MQRKNLRRIILFGSVVLVGLLIVQGFWMKRAFDMEERQFNHSIQVAMKTIADSIGGASQSNSQVRQLSSKFFFAELNATLNPEQLDTLIKRELALRNIRADYELGIYRADDDTLVYGEYIAATIQWQVDHTNEPSEAGEAKSNFAIYFPNKYAAIAGEIKIWIFSTVVLLLMLMFFIYAIITMLRERRLSEIKEDFVNNLTHEFKTPIANIELASEALKDGKVKEENRQRYFEIIHNENLRLKGQVERILQMGAIDKGGLALELRPINMHELISKISESIRFRFSENAGVIDMQLDAQNHEVLADEFHLSNSVYNVLDNAEKYSNGRPEISIFTRNEKDGLLISIRDAGIGIKEDFQQYVFDKFFRVPTGDVHDVKGFGLGLSYVKTIIEAHKGSVSMKSTWGVGSQFDLYLPIR